MSTFKTREQMLEARKIAERAKMQAMKPTINTYLESGGVRIAIAFPTADMRTEMAAHNFTPADGLNRYERLCATPNDLTVVQNAMRGFFGR